MNKDLTKWKFRVGGLFGGVRRFADEASGVRFLYTVDYYGGKLTCWIDEQQFKAMEQVPPETECRLFGYVVPRSADEIRLEPQALELAGVNPDFQSVSDDEFLGGVLWSGSGHLISRRSWKLNDDSERNEVQFRATAGPVRFLDIPWEFFRKLQEGNFYTVGGICQQSFAYSRRANGSNTLDAQTKLILTELKARK